MTMESEMAMQPEVRWGMLSAANIGVIATLPGIRASRNGRLVAVASREIARAEAIAAREPGARVYNDYEALLEDPQVEAVYIPLPNALHAEWTIRAAEHGKHVLCEKPLGLTAEEVQRMIDACQQHGVLLMEAFMYRFQPRMRWAMAQLAAGRIGPVRMVRSSFSFDIRSRPDDIRLSGALGGGSLMDVGCYPLNFARMVFGQGPVGAAAQVDVPVGSEVEVTMAATLDFGGGRLAVIDSSFTQPEYHYAEVVGERGRLVLPRPFVGPQMGSSALIEVGDETVEQRFAPVDQYQLEVEHFGDCVRSGQPLVTPPADALEQAQAIELIYQSAGYAWPR